MAGFVTEARPSNPLRIEEKDSGVHPWSAEPVKKKPFLWPSGNNRQNLYHLYPRCGNQGTFVLPLVSLRLFLRPRFDADLLALELIEGPLKQRGGCH